MKKQRKETLQEKFGLSLSQAKFSDTKDFFDKLESGVLDKIFKPIDENGKLSTNPRYSLVLEWLTLEEENVRPIH